MSDTVSRFSGRQGDYLAGRPSYPAELLEWLGALYAPPERSAAADVGSGTGKLTAQLLRAGFRVYGVEPNGDMRRAAEALLAGDPRFTSVDGTDRDTGLADGSVDLVTAAQAFHWFDGPAFARECRRVLRPGGRVFLIWHVRRSAPVNRELARVFQTHCPDFHGFSGGIAEDDPRIRAFFGGRYEKRRFPHPLTLDRERFLRRCLSSSYSLREGDAGYPAYLAALEALFDRFSREGLLLQPNETLAYAGEPRARSAAGRERSTS